MKNTIVISGLPGSGNSTVARLLAKKLSWKYFSPGQLFKDISRGCEREQYYFNDFEKICKSKNLEIPEFKENNISNAVLNLWSTNFGKNPDFHKSIEELQVKLAEKGKIVIDGKLSLRTINQSKNKIWLKSSLDSRAKRIAKRDGLNLENSKILIEKRQEKERAEWKKIYGFDYFEQEKEANMVIDSSNIFPNQVVDKILNLLNQ